MKPPGAYKILASRNRSFDAEVDPSLRSARRVERIVGSLRRQIVEGGGGRIRIRRIFEVPREIFRLELEVPELACQRITLLDRDALERLLAIDEVRERVSRSPLAG